MKIITVAFIFQFLLSCWPKVDIISRIRQQYGHQSLFIVRISLHNYIENGLSSDRNVCSVYSVYSTNKIMKIITVAFIFQFLLSCWPKEDIMVWLRHRQ